MSALTAVYFIPMIKKKDAAYHARTFHVTGNCQNVMKKNSIKDEEAVMFVTVENE
ncbi:MAG: hypothetical protein ACLVLA_12700 [Acidaminococcus intestini]|jgi:hypothetical protein|uniref:hypothetical protein n=1 Tax=Acidaminococcus intestini TaxID=187327 RepID=UPI001D05FA53|nr:hypothetical protein [Acidaminococcus intestini]MCB7081981.1 hypothetical protein [Acidaminococcus intestini]